MPMRALVVLLVVLNLGIAVWWIARPPPAPAAAWAQPEGVPRLQLASETPTAAAMAAVDGDRADAPLRDATADAAADAAVPAAAATPPAATVAGGGGATVVAAATPAAVAHCFSAGPFADVAARDAARTRLAARGATAITVRETRTAARGWRVSIAPQADRAAADALVARIRAAGITDFMRVPTGAEENAVALGRYSSERSARQREAALHAAGFGAATAEPVGEASVQHWLDLRAPAGAEADGVPLAARDCG